MRRRYLERNARENEVVSGRTATWGWEQRATTFKRAHKAPHRSPISFCSQHCTVLVRESSEPKIYSSPREHFHLSLPVGRGPDLRVAASVSDVGTRPRGADQGPVWGPLKNAERNGAGKKTAPDEGPRTKNRTRDCGRTGAGSAEGPRSKDHGGTAIQIMREGARINVKSLKGHADQEPSRDRPKNHTSV